MKKLTLVIAITLFSLGKTFSQAILFTTAPAGIGATSQLRAPNGTVGHTYFHGVTIVPASELAGLPVSTTLTAFGFTTTAGANSAVTGTITVYLENTSDATYLKGGTWAGAIAAMTTVYTGTITLPTTASTIDLNLTTPFVFNGPGMYVAYDFVSTGPFATVPVTYAANNSLAGSHYSEASNLPLTGNLSAISAFRPCFRFGAPNPFSNDVAVDNIYSLGSLPTLFGTAHQVSAVVRNGSNATINNINVSLNINGVNTFTDNQTIPGLAAGQSTVITFAPWTPGAQGNNTLTVSVPSDQNNTNNISMFKQKVTCGVMGVCETPSTYSASVGFNTGSGIIGYKFQTPASATVTGVNLAISTNTPAAGNLAWGVLLDITGTILASTNSITIVPGIFGTIQTFTFAFPVAITGATDYYVGFAQPVNAIGYFPVGSYQSAFIPNGIYATCALAGGALTPLTNNVGLMGLEANFAGNCVTGMNNLTGKVSNVLVYPNPAKDILNVNINTLNSNASIEICNLMGQIVHEVKEIRNTENKIDVSNLNAGIYILKLVNGKELNAFKIVIDK